MNKLLDRYNFRTLRERAEKRLLPDELMPIEIALLILLDKTIDPNSEEFISHAKKLTAHIMEYENAITEACEFGDLRARTGCRVSYSMGMSIPSSVIKNAAGEVIGTRPSMELLPPMENRTVVYHIHRDDFKAWLQRIGAWPYKNCLLMKWWADETAHDLKPRKKRKPVIRASTESLLLIDSVLTYYNVQYRDELEPVEAWGRVISGHYPNTEGYITAISDNQKRLTLNGGKTLDREDFCEKYRKRFEEENRH